MRINGDFSVPAVVIPAQYQWISSPQVGVERVMLDRIGDEQARATSIVRYAVNSRFPRHEHPGGEEVLVLSGVFSDEDGQYPEGWYLRNAPGSGHEPYSDSGALIFVKLRQMDVRDTTTVRVDTGAPASWHREGDREVCPLYVTGHEQVRMIRLPNDRLVEIGPAAITELLVVAGQVRVDGEARPQGSWIRLPADWRPTIVTDAHGATMYLKTRCDAGLTEALASGID